MSSDHRDRVFYFSEGVTGEIAVPDKFTFPFYYDPHPLTKIAAAELQRYLETQTDLDHNFGLDPANTVAVIGKMFGVLVIQDKAGKLGYLWAFSGKLGGTNDHPKFVPPVFDMLVERSFFLREQEVIDAINLQLEAIASDADYLRLKSDAEQFSDQSARELSSLKQQLKTNKDARQKSREERKNILSEGEYALFDADLVKQSLYDKRLLKELNNKWKQELEGIRTKLSSYEERIEALKNERKERSAALQDQLFEQYVFLNSAGREKSLKDIFKATAFGKPPSAAGECATPKLLQYAFLHGYKPLAMAEFWWGASPKSEIRKHKQFYPACAGKCKPILAHMLDGVPTEENPFLSAVQGSKLEIVYEDDYLLVANKPPGLRSVPGVDIADSVYTRLKSLLVHTEPLIVHRLDMDTSGLLVVAKTSEAHRSLQKQFLRRTISKRYTALLSGTVKGTEGEIRLPLCGDPYNRPRQLVCFERGKPSITKWKLIETAGNVTKVHFWPLTGRTHQLRMHAAHELGLGAPIIGDDLYGTTANRLHLHAASLAFVHPKTKERLSFELPEDF